MSKYLVLFFIPGPFCGQIRILADQIAEKTGVHPPHLWLAPHVRLHRPIVTDEEDILKKCLTDVVTRARQSSLTFGGGIDRSGSRHIVLRAQLTLEMASLWTGIRAGFASLSEYKCGEHDGSDMLHTVVADIPEEGFNRLWPTIQQFRIGRAVIPVQEITLCRKPVLGCRWESLVSFPIRN